MSTIYINGELHLSERPMYDAVISGVPRKLQVEFYAILMKLTTSSISLITESKISSDVLLEHRRDDLAKNGLVAPFCVVNVHSKSVLLSIRNVLMEPVVLWKVS